MDLPLISHFVQSSVDAAMAEYVAPKSLTLDLKDMMLGDDFKKDTNARGIIVVTIKRAFDFKEGDAAIGPIKKGSADPYVSVGWAKFGKPLFSTRVLQKNMEPYWEETCFLLVTPDELNVDEKLRVQLWDSDRTTADDDLGRIEVDVKQLMKDEETNGKMCDREDGFKALKAGEGMPGKLCWSLGYFSKTRITEDQLTAQEEDPDVKNIDELKQKVYSTSENKLREASKDESDEIEQQKAQDLKVGLSFWLIGKAHTNPFARLEKMNSSLLLRLLNTTPRAFLVYRSIKSLALNLKPSTRTRSPRRKIKVMNRKRVKIYHLHTARLFSIIRKCLRREQSPRIRNHFSTLVANASFATTAIPRFILPFVIVGFMKMILFWASYIFL